MLKHVFAKASTPYLRKLRASSLLLNWVSQTAAQRRSNLNFHWSFRAYLIASWHLDRKIYLLMADFNRAAAFELAQIDRAAVNTGDKKDETNAPWQKIKVDRQIVAIGKSLGAALVISGDSSVRNNALRIGMQGMTIQELELPASARQQKLALVPVKKTLAKKS